MNARERLFTHSEEVPWEELGGGLRRKILSYDDHVMLVVVAFDAGGVGALHHHIHRQISYVAKGAFEITIGAEKQILREGDVYFIPPSAIHGAVCMEEGILVDVFSPMREDFIS